MGPIDAFKLGLRKSFVFSGRASRSEFWFFYILYSLIMLIVLVPVVFLLDPQPDEIGFWAFAVASTALSIPLLSAAVRRWHDTNHSAWWFVGIIVYMQATIQILKVIGAPAVGPMVFALFAPIFVVMFWFQITLYFWPGTAGPNRYGPDPLAISGAD